MEIKYLPVSQMHGLQLPEFSTVVMLNGEFGELKFPHLCDMQISEGLYRQLN